MDHIITNLKEQDGLKGLLLLRLVSKSWKDACQEYSGGIKFAAQRPDDLAHACKALPNLSELTMSLLREGFNLYPLSRCSRLSDISLSTYQSREDRYLHAIYLEQAYLPATIRALALESVCLEPAYMGNLTRLTRVRFLWPSNFPPGIRDGLLDLPKLQVCLSAGISMTRSGCC